MVLTENQTLLIGDFVDLIFIFNNPSLKNKRDEIINTIISKLNEGNLEKYLEDDM
jgi:hypothetical protein